MSHAWREARIDRVGRGAAGQARPPLPIFSLAAAELLAAMLGVTLALALAVLGWLAATPTSDRAAA